jgi:alpha-glucosidase
VLSYRRGSITVLVNTGPDPVALPGGDMLLASGPLAEGALPTDTSAWLRSA